MEESPPAKPKKRKKKHGHRLTKTDKEQKARLRILHEQTAIAKGAAVQMQEPALRGVFSYLPGLFVSFPFNQFSQCLMISSDNFSTVYLFNH